MGKKNKSVVWSFSSEIFARLVSPVINMVLARILVPSDFGMIAVCNMVVSFVDILTDAGFGKYLVQYNFKSEEEKIEYSYVAFWSNLCLSVFLWLLIFVKAKSVAILMGDAGYAQIIPIACLQLIFTSVSSIQTGLLRRNFEFKKLFYVRIIVSMVPLVVTLPLAICYRSYWALIFGNLSGSAINAVILIICSKWKLRLYYSFEKLKKMLSFSIWSMFEALAHWLIFWIDTFIVGRVFSDYYLGLYKNCSNMIFSIMTMIISAVTPVLFSTLSREQESDSFDTTFFMFEKFVMYLVFPIGIGIYFYQDFATLLLFGNQWLEGAPVVGCWALMMMTSIIIYSLPAEALKAKGKPKLLFFYQMSYIAFLIPICIVSANMNFSIFVHARSLSILIQAVEFLFILKYCLKCSVKTFFKYSLNPFLCSMVVLGSCLITRFLGHSILESLIQIVVIATLYFIVVWMLFRKDVQKVIKLILKR